MITQNKLQLSANNYAGQPLGMAASVGTNVDSESRDRPAQWDHAHWYGVPAATGITARSGGGQGSATALAAAINRVTTVAAAADSVALPASAAGAWCVIINSGANALQLFGNGTDTINGVASGTGVSVAAGKTYIVFSPAAGLWFGGVLA